jgi:hypothetical protein
MTSHTLFRPLNPPGLRPRQDEKFETVARNACLAKSLTRLA